MLLKKIYSVTLAHSSTVGKTLLRTIVIGMVTPAIKSCIGEEVGLDTSASGNLGVSGCRVGWGSQWMENY